MTEDSDGIENSRTEGMTSEERAQQAALQDTIRRFRPQESMSGSSKGASTTQTVPPARFAPSTAPTAQAPPSAPSRPSAPKGRGSRRKVLTAEEEAAKAEAARIKNNEKGARYRQKKAREAKEAAAASGEVEEAAPPKKVLSPSEKHFKARASLGCRIIDIGQAEHGRPWCAGVLNLKDTTELLDLWFSPASARIYTAWAEQYDNNFGLSSKKTRFTKSLLLQFASKMSEAEFMVDHELRDEEMKGEASRQYVITAYYIRKLMAEPSLQHIFTGSLAPDDEMQVEYFGINADDWMRGVYYLIGMRYAINNQAKENRNATSGPNGEAPAAGFATRVEQQAQEAALVNQQGDDGVDSEKSSVKLSAREAFEKAKKEICRGRCTEAKAIDFWTDDDYYYNKTTSAQEYESKATAKEVDLVEHLMKMNSKGPKPCKNSDELESRTRLAETTILSKFESATSSKNMDQSDNRLPESESRRILQTIGKNAMVVYGEQSFKFDKPDQPYAEMKSAVSSLKGNRIDGVQAVADEIAVGEAGNQTLYNTTDPAKESDIELAVAKPEDLAAIRALNLAINNRSGPAPALKESLKYLKIDPSTCASDPKAGELLYRWPYRGLLVYSWQIIGVAWILMKLDSLLQNALLADDTGLGKTNTAVLAALEKNAREANRFKHRESLKEMDKEEDIPTHDNDSKVAGKDEEAKFRPTLVVIPNAAADAWNTTLKGLSLQYWNFYGSKDKADSLFRTRTLGSTKSLLEVLDEMDPSDPETGRTFIVTTFTTFWQRTLKRKTQIIEVQAPKEVDSVLMNGEDAADEEHESTNDFKKLDEDSYGYLSLYSQSRLEDRFGLVIVDEAHKIKNKTTKTALAILKLEAEHHIFLTASPMINDVSNLEGILDFFWRPIQSNKLYTHRIKTGREHNPVLEYDRVAAMLGPSNSSGQDSFCNIILDPVPFARVFSGKSSTDAELSQKIIPAIMSMISLRRVSGQELVGHDGETFKIGDNIPPWIMTTVELLASCCKHRQFIADAEKAAILEAGYDLPPEQKDEIDALYTGIADDSQALGFAGRRHINHVVFNGIMSQFSKRSIDISADKLIKLSKDSSYNSYYLYWHVSTVPWPSLPPYTGRLDQARYIAGMSPKLQAMARILDIVLYIKKDSCIIMEDWPAEIWCTRLFLNICGIGVAVVRAGQSAAERQRNIEAFRNPKNDINVLVCSSRAAATSLNLQFCHHMIIGDVLSVPSDLQCVGRMSRIGQLYIQYIWKLTVNGTMDIKLQHRAAMKHVAMLTASSGLTVTELDYARFEDEDETNLHKKFEEKRAYADTNDLNKTDMDTMNEILVFEHAAEMYRLLLGQSESRASDTWLEAQLKICKEIESQVWDEELDAAEMERRITVASERVSREMKLKQAKRLREHDDEDIFSKTPSKKVKTEASALSTEKVQESDDEDQAEDAQAGAAAITTETPMSPDHADLIDRLENQDEFGLTDDMAVDTLDDLITGSDGQDHQQVEKPVAESLIAGGSATEHKPVQSGGQVVQPSSTGSDGSVSRTRKSTSLELTPPPPMPNDERKTPIPVEDEGEAEPIERARGRGHKKTAKSSSPKERTKKRKAKKIEKESEDDDGASAGPEKAEEVEYSNTGRPKRRATQDVTSGR
ncbi:Hypothetical protein D9617_35g089660 [Elsinoe fawcettii]|nr:Hypothetical protein D9617_35g089660 [Elsinoe fawcettii]